MGENDELINDFLVESYENLDRLDRDFLALEQDPTNINYIGSIFRTIHTIKGTSGFFGFEQLQALTHVGENLLSKLREGKLFLNKEMTSTLLVMVDVIRAMLMSIEATKQEGERNDRELIATLTALLDVQPTESTTASNGHHPGPLTAMFEAANAAVQAGTNVEEALVELGLDKTNNQQANKGNSESSDSFVAFFPNTERQVNQEIHSGSERHEPKNEINASQVSSLADSSLRVDVVLLDRLMTLVGELVLARNQIIQLIQTQGNPTLISTGQRLSQLTSELQDGVMRTRMQPIGNIWNKFPRVVRDLSESCGKKVRLELFGKETELDKALLEAIKDPLTHIVRNAIDHGFEIPEKRIAAGKSEEGLLTLSAVHEGGLVVVEICDDGGGINCERVCEKAIEKGIIDIEQAEQMTEREMVNLIFMPGFSTAEHVTNISGRGVGMDVVKTNIERIGGHVDIQSITGQGTTLRIKIPLTLAIIPALIVACGEDRFAIPQVCLVELLRLSADSIDREIENVYGAPVYRLRGQLLPVIFLRQELHLSGSGGMNDMTMVVLHSDNCRFCLVVDAVYDAEEIVVKPLAKMLKFLSVYSGSTIMGDGKVALILDITGLARRVHASSQKAIQLDAQQSVKPIEPNDRQAVLIFQSPDDGRMAIPVSAIARLEEVDESRIEQVGGNEMLQYRGGIVPIIRVFRQLPERRKDLRNPNCGMEDGTLQIIIHRAGERHVGLVVGKIIDTIEHNLVIDRAAGRAGIIGCFVIQNRVTELLDLEGMVRINYPDFYSQYQST